MDFATLIAARQAALDALIAQRAAHRAEQNQILEDAGSVLSGDAETRFAELQDLKRDLGGQITAARAGLDQLHAEHDADLAATRAAAESRPAAERRAYDEVARIGAEQRTYNPDSDKRGQAFLRDVSASFFGDGAAAERLHRHMNEERVERGGQVARAAGTSAFAGLVVPQYLTDLYAPATAALRPFADVCNRHPLPADGMTVNISQITTATSVAIQSSQNTAVSETNIDDTLMTINVQTAAGQQTLSRQAIERGTGIEEVALDDLFRRFATTLDSTLLNQATNGLTNVAGSITYTDASPTAAELYPQVLAAVSASETALLGQAIPDYAVMHSRRWHWMQSQLGSTWPLIQAAGLLPQVGGQANGNGYNEGVRGILPSGLQVIVDNNIATNLGTGTNQDEIYVVASRECHLWEDPSAPVFIRAEQPNAASLGVTLVVYGYFAYTFARYTSGQAKVGGTGLVTPSFA